MLSYSQWIAENSCDVLTKVAETGADREIFYNSYDYLMIAYKRYAYAYIQTIQAVLADV